MTVMKLAALTAKGAVKPYAVTKNPVIAGPIARLKLILILPKATACDKFAFETILGINACQAGAIKAPPIPNKKVKHNTAKGEASFLHTMNANSAAASIMNILMMISSLRRSIISANAPAGSASKKTGKVVDVCTNATINGDVLKSAINQLAATEFIQVPIFEISAASQNIVKAECLKGSNADSLFGMSARMQSRCIRDFPRTDLGMRKQYQSYRVR